jgi:hypothetical protein
MRRQGPSSRQAGQAIVFVALMMVVLISGIGLAVDGGLGYYYNAAASRAAAAAALSGVIFMPNQFLSSQASPAGSGNDATDRAKAEAKRNGFDTADAADGVTVSAAAVPGYNNRLQVTVSRNVTTFFMRMFGVPSFPVTRVAVAEYLAPISLGQPGGQAGSTVSQLGTGNNYYFMREFGWSADRGQGDAFSPNPASEYGAALNPASLDVHQLSAQTGADTVDPALPARGGYNYLINLPAAGAVQIYNAAFAPDNNAVHNTCENSRVAWFLGPIGPCSTGGNYYYHEEDSVDFANKTTFDAMEYSLFKVTNAFIRSSDVEIAKVTVLPIDATRWNQASSQYTNVVTGAAISQSYNFNGTPSNMLVYHNWIDVANYAGAGDGGLVQRALTTSSPLAAGTYRLRVDSLSYNGGNPPDTGLAHKGYAVRAVDSSGNLCVTCAVGATNDMASYTPISTVGGGSFVLPILQVPPSYAGETVTVDIFDPGDISGGNLDISVLDPSGAVVTPTAPATVAVTDLGVSRAFNGTAPTVVGNPATATFRAASGGNVLYNGHWIDMRIPVPSTYSPGANPNLWYWSLKYATSSGTTATDTETMAVGLAGSPAHLLSG